MPVPRQAYEVLLDFTNDTHDSATIQLLRDYGRRTGAIVLLHPGESVTLVLDAGSIYRYALKMRSKVADVTRVLLARNIPFISAHDRIYHFSARTWRDIQCDISHLFSSGPSGWPSPHSTTSANGVTVDRVWRDNRFCIWDDT
jgi:hypothetical protein